MRKVGLFFVFISAAIVLSSCGRFRKIEKSQDWRVKYEAGLNYFAKKDYYKASVLFEQILPVVRGMKEGEIVQFDLAYCQYYEKMYLLAAEQFRTFAETYGRSSMVEEARFMYAYSLYRSSPNYNLDQTASIDAMSYMQQFLNRYPNSKFKDQATEVIFTTQDKLERKGFENARQYYKMRWYSAAIVALQNFQRNFPDSEYLEESQYLVVASTYKLAKQSIASKQLERYKEVVDQYKDFIDRYPSSEFLREAERYYTESMVEVSKRNIKNKSI